MYRLPVHLFIGIDPLVDDPLIAVEYGAAHVGHPGVRLAVGPPHVPVQQAARLRLHAQSHLKNSAERCQYTVKKVDDFPVSRRGMSLTKLSLAGKC